MKIDVNASPSGLKKRLDGFWQLAAAKALALEREYDPSAGSPVYTVEGKYTTRGWTEWTHGFQYGIPLLVFSATGDPSMLRMGRANTLQKMAPHLTHFGVHDHGFNNLSTYGNLLRCSGKGLYEAAEEEKELYRLALKVSGAVQAKRWTQTSDGAGFIHSFNGPHSLFIDTMRTLRILLAAHKLGHRMLEENDREVVLLERALIHGMTTARYAVYYGKGRDRYDVRGRVAHESVFNVNDGRYRCPNSQQGYSGFSTWTRGLAWAMLGFAELLEFMATLSEGQKGQIRPGAPQTDAPETGMPQTGIPHPGPDGHFDADLLQQAVKSFLEVARATCDYYLAICAADGIPYWDTGAPDLNSITGYRERPADPFNRYEPVDSSAAAIGAQGLIRLGRYLAATDPEASLAYISAGMTILQTLLSDTYLSKAPGHQGILLHSVYHHPNGWDHIPEGQHVPCGESSMWGDYHMTELCYLVSRMADNDYYTFFEGIQ